MPYRAVLVVYAWLVPTATYISLIAVAVVSLAAWLAISRAWAPMIERVLTRLTALTCLNVALVVGVLAPIGAN
jgi:hypothetical protein